MRELKSMTYCGRGAMGDDEVYNLVFANGAMTVSAKLDSGGRMAGGFFQQSGPPRR